MVVRQVLTLAALGSFLAVSGCTERRDHTEQGRQTQRGPGEVTTPPPTVSPGTSAEGSHGSIQARDTTDTVNGILSLIHEEESKLSQIITAGRLHEVRASAIRIRDFLVSAASRADIAADQRAALDQHVSTMKDLAAALGEAGDGGDLEKTKALNGTLQKEVGVIERMIGRVGA
jgi:hypothetical protein